MKKSSRGILLLIAASALFAAAASARDTAEIDRILSRQTGVPSGRIVVKFTEQSGLKAGDAGINADDPARGRAIRSLLAGIAPGHVAGRHFSGDEASIRAHRLAAEARSGRKLPDLTRYARIDPGFAASDRKSLDDLLAALLASPDVETAFLEPRPVPAAIGFNADGGFTPPAESGPAPPIVPAATTPQFSSLQEYLAAPPYGMNALAAAAHPGGDGAGTRIIDIEGAWLWPHEDIPPPFYSAGGMIDDQDWRNHGTAVLGEIVGRDNSYGVRGMAPAAQAGGISIDFLSTADAIEIAAENLDPGDVILIELHAPGPNSIEVGQYGFMPMEYWQDVFDATQIATASGIIVVAAAGNGEQNLDSPQYGDIFDRDVRDSGSIMVAATDKPNSPSSFTNYGSRIDLNGWGNGVVTTGYGNLQGPDLGFPESQWYTHIYSGTSSAAAMVAGAVLSLQGMFAAERDYPLTSQVARRILNSTGTPASGGLAVGSRPELIAARSAALDSVGEVTGLVIDSVTYVPLAGIEVSIRGGGGTTLTDASGTYSLTALAGPVELDFFSFYFEPADTAATVVGGQSVTVTALLERLPALDIGGRVTDISGAPLADVRVSIAGTGVPPEATDSGGEFLFDAIPRGVEYYLVFDYLPGYGADITPVDTRLVPGDLFSVSQELVATSQDFNLSHGDFGMTNSIWAWAQPYQGPLTGFDEGDDNCWGVGMAGPYPASVSGALVSPSYDFAGEDELRLSFHYWSDTEKGFDGANLRVSVDGEWVVVEPLTGYTDDYITALGFQPGWSGESDGWCGAVFDLAAYADSPIKFSILFASDNDNQDVGFFVDTIAWDTGNVITSVEPGQLVPAPPAAISAYPNPFNPATTISWRRAAAGPLEVAVFDLRGRLIDVLLDVDSAAADGVLRWNGTDGSGRSVPSGVYFVRLRGDPGVQARRMVTLVK